MTRGGQADPALSLVIVTYRREAELLRNLGELRPWRDLFSEILVVDNGNSPTLGAEAHALLGDRIRILPQEQNRGAVARSIGILAASGDIIVTLDDDVRFLDPGQLLRAKNLFAAHDRVGCVNFKILYQDGVTLDLSDWCHPRDHHRYADSLFETTYISEGACAFSAALVKSVGAYSLDLFIGQEGVELAARILDRGYGIYYLPSVSVTHSVSTEGRTSGRQFFFNARNIYWIALRAYPATLALQTVAREWLTLLGFSLIRWRLGHFLRGCYQAIVRTPELLRTRRPVGADTAEHIVHMHRLKPSVWRRAARVKRSKTLD